MSAYTNTTDRPLPVMRPLVILQPGETKDLTPDQESAPNTRRLIAIGALAPAQAP